LGRHHNRNHLIHKPRTRSGRSAWQQSFDCSDVKPLIICRGPVRLEAMTVFEEMGIHHFGILLSQKDSISYPRAMSPEIRTGLPDKRIHRVVDYTGKTKEERVQRVDEIIQITKDHDYNAVFAGYGFMAEDETLVTALEAAGVSFIGPCAATVRAAGNKDLAKRTAIAEEVSVTPGVDNATERTLQKRHPNIDALKAVISEHHFDIDITNLDFETATAKVLSASYDHGIDLFTIDELSQTLTESVRELMIEHPGYRIRLKAIGGGGGKGQRIIDSPAGQSDADIQAATSSVDSLLNEILSEVGTGGIGDNKNVLAELNIETVRHIEIQVVGNGVWCMTMGGRDCSVQMNEQKLLELSLTVPELEDAIKAAKAAGDLSSAATLEQDLVTLEKMESEASRFGTAVGLDSVSTFECIVDPSRHFFMEMNTRVQVEHRVSELCYSLQFANPDDIDDEFTVDSIIELMVLLSRHGKRLPKPSRVRREGAAAEIRLNASDDSLKPHAGGVITDWSAPVEEEIRDDQGICLLNPDTDMFMRYYLAGAYDSNIALELTTGVDREEALVRAARLLGAMKISGENLSTNLNFHYGLVNWLLGQNAQARPSTNFSMAYLTMVGQIAKHASDVDLNYAWSALEQKYLADCDAEQSKVIAEIMTRKSNLVIRAVQGLLDQPHFLAGWLARNQANYSVENGHVIWSTNLLQVLADMYRFLNMMPDHDTPPLYAIWPEDLEILDRGLDFYHELGDRDMISVDGQLEAGADTDVIGAHHGYQMGLELLSVLPFLAECARYHDFQVSEDLTIKVPAWAADSDVTAESLRFLSPPPAAASDELTAPSGGMYYAREAPDRPPLIEKGDHFNAGDDLCVIEVMKMFNKVKAPFSGTIDAVLIDDDATIVKKGQTLFKVTPDEIVVLPTEKEIASQRQTATDAFLATIEAPTTGDVA